jgi:hypothetical protein
MTEQDTIDATDSTVVEENQTEGNLSDNDLVNLFNQEEVQEDPQESTELSGETEDESQPVLSQSNDEDIEDIEEDTAEEVPKSVQKLLKQVSKLTARAKSSEEKNQELQDQLKSLSEKTVESEANTTHPEISKVKTLEELEVLKAEAQQAKRWAMSNLGKSYVEENGKEYTDDEIRAIFSRSDEYLTELIPEREKFLMSRTESKTRAKNSFPFLNQEGSQEYELYHQIKKSPQYKVLDQLPNAEFVRGVIVKGVLKMREEETITKARTTKSKKAPPPAMPASDAVPRRTRQQDSSKILGKENITEENLTAFLLNS